MECKRADYYGRRYAESLAMVRKFQAETRTLVEISEQDRDIKLLGANDITHKGLTVSEHGNALKNHVRDCKRCARPPDTLTAFRQSFPDLFTKNKEIERQTPTA
jgi:hypothetical protein